MKLKLHNILMFLLVFFISCNTSPYGKKIKVNDRIEVYIKNGATEADAKKFGDYIDTTWKTSTNKKSFQLSKDHGSPNPPLASDAGAIPPRRVA